MVPLQLTYRPPVGPKSIGVAYVLALFLGGFGAHRFYLGRVRTAVMQLILFFGYLTLRIFFGATGGSAALFALSIWVIIDLFLIPRMARQANGIEPYW